MSKTELLIKLVEVTIWPLTLLLILFLFKKNFADAFNRLGAIKADSTGLSLTFEKALETTKSKFQMNKPEEMFKSNSIIQNEDSTSTPPYKQLMDVKESLETAIIELATEEGMETLGKNSNLLINDLKNKGVLNNQKSELIQALLHLIQMARMDISQTQINEIKKMYYAL